MERCPPLGLRALLSWDVPDHPYARRRVQPGEVLQYQPTAMDAVSVASVSEGLASLP